MNTTHEVRAVILAGGSGTRLWPLSRLQAPKQFLRLTSDQSLLEATVSRLDPLIGPESVVIITSEESARGEGFQVLERFQRILEPVARNTGPAVGIAAAHFALSGIDPVMVVLPADHLITDIPAFHANLRTAIARAEEGKMILFGVRPTRAETGYGYIQGESGVGDRAVARFHEKPRAEVAEQFVASGYYWNSGMFVWKASVILAEIRRHQPELAAVLDRFMASVRGGRSLEAALAEHLPQAPSVSIDKGVLERSANAWVVPADFGWSDIGSWDSVHEAAQRDASGNALHGPVVAIDCRDSLIRSESRLVSVLGVRDVIVVETADAVLVANRHQSQRVREIVDQLATSSSKHATTPNTVRRPWGTYTVLEESASYKIKRIEVRPGGRLSLQSHRHRSEHWVVVKGTATVTIDGVARDLQRNQSTYVAIGARHRLENRTSEAVQLIEVQVGDYLEEDDITRYDDDYGRKAETKQEAS